MERDTRSQKFPLGSELPTFELPDVSGKTLGSSHLRSGKAALVVFTCNHCPYVQGSEEMLMAIARRFEASGLKIVTISSNDAGQYPEDGFEKMQEKARNMALPYPYLYDESQDVARKFDAACTPECFLFDGSSRLVYQGALTDRPRDKGASRKDLLSPVIEQIFRGEKVASDFNHPIGCSIKWR